MHLFTKSPLGPDAKTIPDQQHPDQQLGIDGRASRVAIEIRQMGADAVQINEPINRPQQVVLGDVILERELVEQCRLRFLPRSHHCQSLPTGRIESATYHSIKREFFNEIGR